MNKDEYIILNKTTIQKRIEKLEKEIKFLAAKDAYGDIGKLSAYKQIISQSTPLIPEIEKAHNVGRNYGCYLQGGSYNHNDNIDSENYISNLKLDI